MVSPSSIETCAQATAVILDLPGLTHVHWMQALRLIKFLCGKGTSDFKRQMAKHAVAVR